jgi:hypothetical protein
MLKNEKKIQREPVRKGASFHYRFNNGDNFVRLKCVGKLKPNFGPMRRSVSGL